MDVPDGNQPPATTSGDFPPSLSSEAPDTPKPTPADPSSEIKEQEQGRGHHQEQEQAQEQEREREQEQSLPQSKDGSRDTPTRRIDVSPLQSFVSPSSQRSYTAGGHRNSVTSPGPVSAWSGGSEMQLGFSSMASDTSGDRVFPIRSVVSVDPATASRSSAGEASQSTDMENQVPHGYRPSNSRHETRYDIRRSDTVPISSASGSHGEGRHMGRWRSSFGGPISSIQADAARHGSVPPLQLEIEPSEKGTDESGALGGQGAGAAAAGAEAAGLDSRSGTSQHPSITDVPHVSSRFTHIETSDGHSVITGRDGTLQRCEDEPIHTPGAVQGFGVLLALREEKDGCFLVRYVSENSEKMLGYTPTQLFRLSNFMDILTEEQQDNLLDHIDFIRDEDADPAVSGPEVFSLAVRPPKRKTAKLWCAIHINPAHPDIVICEFELDDDLQHPLRPPDENTPDAPYDTLQANPSLAEIEESTEILSKPLRILRSARKRRGEQGAMQVFDIMSQVQEQLASAPNLDTFLKVLIGIVKELTGFHRVMIYQFDSAFNGKVVSELVDPAHTRDLYHGLNFPASDIPRQARDLYKLNKVRLLYDRDLQTARIVCRTKEDLETPLDMSHAYLRAMSPIHLKYLGNMAVRASMSISINAFNELWGLIACHSYGNHGMRVSFPIRKMCRLVGDTASRNIERLSYASRLQARKLINTAPTDKNPSGYIIASSDDLLRLFDADFGLLSIKGETKFMGSIDHSQEALAMLEYLRMRKLTAVTASQDVREDFPDLVYPPGFQVIAGLLYVPLSVGGSDFIVFFRKCQVKEVKWAGNPYEKSIRDGTAGYLEPRTSFKTWFETVVGKCRDWNEEQVETAAVLCLVYGKFIEVWRQKEAAIQSSKLTRLLLANSAHEVRTPLNAIINYLEIALEGSLDSETRDNLARSHSASKSLIYVINDLLDLTKTEEGQELVKDEIFELSACIEEATEPFQKDSYRKGIEYEVVQHPGLPRFVCGDGRRVRQAISNVTANAIAHTDKGFVKVEVFVSDVDEHHATIDFVIADSGLGMSTQQLDGLFRDLEQVSTADSDADVVSGASGDGQNARTLGLGLAVVARTIRNMDGQLRLKSEEGQGSRFVIQLPFQLADEPPPAATEGEPEKRPETSLQSNVASAPADVLAAPEGEMVLVERGSAMHLSADFDRQHDGEVRSKGTANSRHSVDSQGSHGSHMSGADRLINAIQTPLSLTNKEPEYPAPPTGWKDGPDRPSSKGSQSATGPSSPQSPILASGPGFAAVRGSKVPIRPVKVPEDYKDMPDHPQVGSNSRVLFELPAETRPAVKPPPESVASVTSGGTGETGSAGDGQYLHVLIAEDDPVNMKIMRKRLERAGHTVAHAVNGQDCAAVYKERSADFDLVLMDMQMPIVDGLTSTKMIRAFERTAEHPGHSKLASALGRIPIFAVSASLVEQERPTYIDAGFDGWILKPIDFKRLVTLLTGIHHEKTRESCLYAPGGWEHGGWFHTGLGSETASSDDKTPTMEEDKKDILTTATDEPAADASLGSDTSHVLAADT